MRESKRERKKDLLTSTISNTRICIFIGSTNLSFTNFFICHLAKCVVQTKYSHRLQNRRNLSNFRVRSPSADSQRISVKGSSRSDRKANISDGRRRISRFGKPEKRDIEWRRFNGRVKILETLKIFSPSPNTLKLFVRYR